MMQIKKVIDTSILIIILGVFFCSIQACDDKKVSSPSEIETMHNLRMILIAPDSLRSTQNNALLQQLEMIIYNRCVIENGRFELTIDKQEWKKTGIQEEFYDMIEQEVKDLNNFLDTTSFSKKLILDSYQIARQEYNEKSTNNRN